MTSERPKSAEMSAGPGFMIRREFERPGRKLVDDLATYDTTDVSDAMNRMYAMSGQIRNVTNDQPLCGPALTVKTFPGDNLMVHKALDLAEPGDVIVIDASQSMTAAMVGDLIANKAKSRGVAGFILDGLIRDHEGVIETGLPIYARGITPFGPLHRGPGEINYPISCGGIVVNPGDIVTADKSGVTVVPNRWAEEVLRRLGESRERLAAYIENVKMGNFSNAWVDRQLEDDGCLFE